MLHVIYLLSVTELMADVFGDYATDRAGLKRALVQHCTDMSYGPVTVDIDFEECTATATEADGTPHHYFIILKEKA